MTKKEERIVNLLKNMEETAYNLYKHYDKEQDKKWADKYLQRAMTLTNCIDLIQDKNFLESMENIYKK